MAELIHGLDAERVRANLEAVRAEIADACARAARDPADVEVLAAVEVRHARRGRRARGRRHHARRREPCAGPRRQTGALGRAAHVRLHRAPAEPQGPPGAAACALDPLGGQRLGARAARAPRVPRDRGARRGERRWGGGQERRSPCGSGRIPGPLPVPRRRPDDDAALHAGRPRRAAAGSPRCAHWRMRGACANCRWGPRRTSPSPSRRAPRSSGSGPASTAEPRPAPEDLQENQRKRVNSTGYGLPGLLAPRARLLRPRRGSRPLRGG